jgi:membrane protein implicated in regulation of membrane protease activity
MPTELDTKMLWFIAGLILILLEFAAPGVVVIFFGLGAWVVAMAMWAGLIESVPAQCLTFAVASLILLFALRRYVASWFVGGASDGTSNLEEEFTGKTVRVVHTIGGGEHTGKVELKGAEWNARSEGPIEEGETATVVRRDGLELIVEPKESI